MKIKTIEGYTINYERWHFGIHATFVIQTHIDKYGQWSTRVHSESINDWIKGLRHGDAKIDWLAFRKTETTIHVIFTDHATLMFLAFNITHEDANRLADELEAMRDNPQRQEQQIETNKILLSIKKENTAKKKDTDLTQAERWEIMLDNPHVEKGIK